MHGKYLSRDIFFSYSCDCLSLEVNGITTTHCHFDLIGLKSKILPGFCHSQNIIFHLTYISNLPIFSLTDHILPFHLILLISTFRMCAQFKAVAIHRFACFAACFARVTPIECIQNKSQLSWNLLEVNWHGKIIINAFSIQNDGFSLRPKDFEYTTKLNRFSLQRHHFTMSWNCRSKIDVLSSSFFFLLFLEMKWHCKNVYLY